MRKFTKCLMALALLIGGSTTANASYDIQLTTKFTSVASLSGKVFAIADETAGKAFYGPTGGYGHEVGFDVYATAFSNEVNYYYFKLVDIPADKIAEDPTLADYTLIRACKADGSLYTFWGDGGNGYLNTNNDICFLLGITAKNLGQDFDYGAVWKVTYVDGKGFTLQNKYTGDKYLKDAGAPKNDDPTYFTFAEVESVEVFDPDTSDPGIPAVADGWKSLITNGDLTGDDVTSFWTKNEDGAAIPAVRVADVGRFGGPGIKVVTKDGATNDWGTQFFIKSSEKLKEGQKLHIEFDYRGERAQKAATQVHRAPGDYNANIDNVNFTVNWKHYSNVITITEGMCKQDGGAGDFYLQSFCLNLSENKSTGNFYFDNIVMWTEEDPLMPQKVALQNAIAKGNAQSSFAKTAASFAVLTDAVSAGETELANASATAQSLTDAATAINDAIAGLVLENGYTNLTKNMYMQWDSATEPTTGTDASGACDYVLFSSTGQPYGHGSVPLLSFADLSTFDKLYVLATGGTPRILLNRDVDNGQCSATESESHLIDNTNGNCMTWASGYFTTEGSNVTVDLKQLATNKGFAHLHTIKSANGNVTVSDMLLYRAISVGSAGYATFGSLYKNAKPNGVTAYAAKVSGGKVDLTEVTNVPAGKGVVIMASAGSYAPTFDVSASDIDTDLLVSNGTVVGDGTTIYVLANKNSVPGFYKLASGQKVPAGKAYLKITTPAPEFLPFDGNTTGIETVKAVESKGEFFNLAGQRVAQPAKGLYIVNGKKVIFK